MICQDSVASALIGKKQASIDSGNDGDISCFDASDASTIGIDAIAASRKDKVCIFIVLSMSTWEPERVLVLQSD